MKICIVSSEYPPFHGGGIGTYAAVMSRFLAEAGHQVHVITNGWAQFADGDAKDQTYQPCRNLWVHPIDALTREYGPRPPHDGEDDWFGQVCRQWDSSLYWSLHATEMLSRLHREVGFDVVEYPECFAESYVAMRRRRLGIGGLDLPMVITLHSPIQEVIEYNLYRKCEAWYRRRTMMEDYGIRNADTLISPSRHLALTVFDRLGLSSAEHPCDVIPNPMDFDALGEIPEPTLEAEDAEPSLLFVGRIEPRKGVKYLIDAAVKILPEIPQLKIHLIGRDCDAGEVPGSMKNFLLGRIPAELRDRFVFEGLLPREQVVRRYASATACIFPAPWDNFPYTCCEAMANGACVIASDRSGMAEMIEHERSGLLFPTTNVDALAATIRRALSDPQLRLTLRRNAGPRIRQVCDPSSAVRRRVANYELAIQRYRERTDCARSSEKHIVLAASAANSESPPMPATPRTLALFVTHDRDQAALKRTVESVLVAAQQANLKLEVNVSGTPQNGQARLPIDRLLVPQESLDPTAALRSWLSDAAAKKSDFLMCMSAGETIDLGYLGSVLSALDTIPQAGWATTWAKPLDERNLRPFAGFDFSAPLEMMYYHPVPFAVIRRSAFEAVGGWDLELPNGWRQWDLWLAFHQAAWEGIIVPEWQAHFRCDTGLDLQVPGHAKTYELIIERVMRRNRKLYGEHAGELWMNQLTNPKYSSPAAAVPFEPVYDSQQDVGNPAVNAPAGFARQRAVTPAQKAKRFLGRLLGWHKSRAAIGQS